MAEIFGVEISTLKEIEIENYNEIMQTLFFLEDEFGLTTANAEHVLPGDAVLVFNKRTLQNIINAWHEKKMEIELAGGSENELRDWELRYPYSHADDCKIRIDKQGNGTK